MRFLFSFLCLLSAVALAENPQPLALDQKIQVLEQELADVRSQQHIEQSEDVLERVEPILSQEYELYEQGRHYLAQQRLDLAHKVFDEVVEKYEGTPESILARFWIGEFMVHAKNYAGASISFGQAYGALKQARRQKSFSLEAFHGEQDRLPEILAKLAYALKMINKRQDACLTLRQLNKEYKTRPETLQWYINTLSKDLRCR